MDKAATRRADQGARLKEAREAASFRSARAAALEMGWPESTYRAHEGGTRTIGQDDAERYAAGFRRRGAKVTSQAILFDGGEDSAVEVIRPEGPEESETRPAPDAPRFSEMGDFDVEVRGVTVGGEDDEFYFNGQVLEYVRRPPGLSRKKEVFAVNVSNDSMYPRYDPGDLVYAQKANPVAGDDVLIELYHPDDENLAGKSFVKTFVRRTGRRITCKQFNPPKEVEFDAGEVRQICKVFRNRDLFG